MTCENAILLMSGHLDGENSAEEEALLQAHLAACGDCRRLMSAYESIEQNTAALETPVPEGFKSGVMYRIEREANPKKQKKRFRYTGTLVGAVAAALVLMVGLGAIRIPALRSKQQTKEPVTEQAAFLQDPQDSAEPNGLIDDEKHPVQNSAAMDAVRQMMGELEERASTAQSEHQIRNARQDATDEVVGSWVRVSEDASAPVLVYTEFGADSLLDLLAREEPELYRLLSEVSPEAQEDGTVVVETSYGAIMALHEWILAHLPQTDEASLQQAQQDLLERMRVLDPSGLLTTIITYAGRTKNVDWPAVWPEDWADRMRRELNWELIFPSETYSPMEDDAAMLVLLPCSPER